MREAKKVAVVGSGLIGRAWATIFARAGWRVSMTDTHAPTLAAAPGLVHEELRGLARHGLANDPDGAATRVTAAASLADALADADFVQENGPEDVDVNIALFT